VSAPVQYAALVAYGDDTDIDEYIDLCTAMHTVRTRYLYDRLAEAGVRCTEPSGAFYLYPDFHKWRRPLAALGVKNSDGLSMHLLEEYGLATLSGSAFGSPPEALSLRLSSSYLDAGTDEQAANLVDVFREDPDPVRFIENHHPRLREAAGRLAEFAASLQKNGKNSPRRRARSGA
jgi:aspartate/methionine/tyrosine aminotransferase